MKKKISPKSIFVFIQCLIMVIAPFFDYWSVFSRIKNRKTPDITTANYFDQKESRFKLFGSNAELKANYTGKYAYLNNIRIVASVIVAILTILALVRLVLYVMEFLNFKFVGRFTYPKILEKIICLSIMILTALLIILVVFMELKSEIGYDQYEENGEKKYKSYYYLFASIGFYLTIIPGIFVGALGKEKKEKKED
ncbi:MAG TPA: hypothetical protein DDY82_05310 [Clostridiales bacterium]|nr:hypothetical protein [Clostridiales bacterium]